MSGLGMNMPIPMNNMTLPMAALNMASMNPTMVGGLSGFMNAMNMMNNPLPNLNPLNPLGSPNFGFINPIHMLAPLGLGMMNSGIFNNNSTNTNNPLLLSNMNPNNNLSNNHDRNDNNSEISGSPEFVNEEPSVKKFKNGRC